MKKHLIIQIMILAFILPAIAEQENLMLGPYKVSFDMGIDDLTNWVVSEPINSESLDGGLTYTRYEAAVATLTYSQFLSESKRLGRDPSHHSASIDITQFNSSKNGSASGTRMMVEAALDGSTNTEISERIIDGQHGTIGSGTSGSTTMYVASWWIENNTVVGFLSTYPWNKDTLSILKTIHIEKINATT